MLRPGPLRRMKSAARTVRSHNARTDRQRQPRKLRPHRPRRRRDLAPRRDEPRAGGAGPLRRDAMSLERAAQYHAGLRRALEAGRDVLADGGSALDAVTAAVVALEDEPLFNAGRGAVFTAAGTQEMDAAVMDGGERRGRAAAGPLCA